MSIVALVATVAGVMHFRGDPSDRTPRAEGAASAGKARVGGGSGTASRGYRNVAVGLSATSTGNDDESDAARVANENPNPTPPPATPPRSSEEEFKDLFAQVERETLDATWANANEAKIREVAKSVPGLTLSAVRCASVRCSAELSVVSRKDHSQAIYRLQRVPGLARAEIRSTRGPEGFALQAVLAREGFEVSGKPESDDP
jgi:hypothetical protein